MIRKAGLIAVLLAMLCTCSGCTGIGDKTLSLTVIYGVTAVAALLLFLVSTLVIKRKEPWFLLLFTCVLVVNTGYLLLSLASSLDMALFANSLAYLGSVFLPLAMFMIILKACELPFHRLLPVILGAVSLGIFFLTLTPLYYTETSLTLVNGAATLVKQYGPLHAVYPVYLFSYFAVMVACIVHAAVIKQFRSGIYAVLLAAAVLINIGVWLLEQLVDINFEFLSVSYIISELFLLGIYMMSRVSPALNTAAPETAAPLVGTEDDPVVRHKAQYLRKQLSTLTPTERMVYDLYVEGKSTKEVLAALRIKENTLKYHNRNLYGKLGVSSRKELIRLANHPETT